MATADCSVAIARPVEDVFAVLTDPTQTPKWSPNDISSELLTPGPPRVGSRRRAVVKGLFGRTMESVMEVTEFEPNRMVALSLISASWGGTGRTKYTFTPAGDGTRVDWHWDMEPGGLMKLFARPFMALFQRAFQRDLNNLKAMMESNRL
jgi:uncharacterized protein YndB with AHSA1/START domain